MTITTAMTAGKKMEDMQMSNPGEVLERLKDHDRFDYPIETERVTSGMGCEAIIVFGSEKAALFDCGMAYCAEKTVENIKKALASHKKKDGSPYTIDYIMASHTHYDHIGALPYILREFPDAVVCGSEKGAYIFTRDGAHKVIKNLGQAAKDNYDPDSDFEIITEGLRIDNVMKDGDFISLGDEKVYALETKGHTDCSMTYIIEPLSLMFASESTGVFEDGEVNTPILKSYNDCMESLEKCRNHGAKYVSVAHYGLLPQWFKDEYWNIFEQNATEKRKLVKQWYGEGLSDEEVLEKYTEVYWDKSKAKQPKDAFMINAKNIVKVLGQD